MNGILFHRVRNSWIQFYLSKKVCHSKNDHLNGSSRDRRAIRCPKRHHVQFFDEKENRGAEQLPMEEQRAFATHGGSINNILTTTIVVFNKDFVTYHCPKERHQSKQQLPWQAFSCTASLHFLSLLALKPMLGQSCLARVLTCRQNTVLYHMRATKQGYHPKCRYWNTTVS